ncbi:MAG: Rne/Rng family ribonuclease [Candidatus Omnitrophota bacterium]
MERKNIKREKQEKQGKEILMNIGPVENRVAVLDNGELADFFMERESGEHYAGTIYKGRVDSIVPGIEAAFVNIGMEKNGFLHVSDVLDKGAVLKAMLGEDAASFKPAKKEKVPQIKDILRVGQEIMVQVVKEAIGTKGPRITTYISIPGRFLVLTPYDKGIGISRRINDRVERKRIREIIDGMGLLGKVGCIVRTVAQNSSEEEFRRELKYLMKLWERIKERSEKEKAPVAVYEEYGLILRLIRDVFSEDMARLIVDSKDEYNRISKFLKSFMPSLISKIKLYNGHMSLFQKYNLEKKIEEIFERKVMLKSGGYLVIEPTEGVVVIDINTGSFVGKRSLEETAFKTNMEAAEEIPRQLILRDMGGIIIIDFIDMEVRDHRDKIYNRLQQRLKGDKARISLRAMSQFGVVEMTRQRMRKSLEGASYGDCPYCGGKGKIKNVETIAIETARRIDRMLSNRDKKRRQINISAHPKVLETLVSDQARILSGIQRKYRCKIDLKEDKSLHIEDVIIDDI